MKTPSTLVAITLMTALVSLPLSTSAQAGRHYDKRAHNVDYAKVTRVEPIIRTLNHRIPRETCWEESVPYQEPYQRKSRSRPDSAVPTVIGGLIGVAIGERFGGNKSNRKMTALAGGLLGAAIGHDISRTRHDVNPYDERIHRTTYRNEQRCEVTYHMEQEEQVDGYNVTYRYRGKTYHTRMDYDPGKKIQVRVNVRPVL